MRLAFPDIYRPSRGMRGMRPALQALAGWIGNRTAYSVRLDSVYGTEPAVYISGLAPLKHELLSPQHRVPMSFFGRASATTTTAVLTNKDVELVDPPPDSISSIAFSPVADFLAVGSWDNSVGAPRKSIYAHLISLVC